MGVLRLSLLYLRSRPLSALLNLLLLTLGLTTMTFVLLVSAQISRAFERDLAGVDLVVGAKGSPMQLILSGLLHLDVPPGNIALADVEALGRDPRVAELIPMSLGDSFRGFRIVGTTPAYVDLHQALLASGRLWHQPLEAVLGAQVARATGLAAGGVFAGSHGLAGGTHEHTASPYKVSGVLSPCDCVLDRLVLTGLESVWLAHEREMAVDEDDRKALEAEREVTLALVRYSSPLAAVTLPRHVNAATALQAASPAVELSRLLSMLGIGTRAVHVLAAVLLVTAALGVFAALWSAVRERRADLALLRMLGAPPRRLSALLVAEALWLALVGSALGLLGGHALLVLTGQMLAAERSLVVQAWAWTPQEFWIPVSAGAVAVAAALIPALSAYRADVALLLRSKS